MEYLVEIGFFRVVENYVGDGFWVYFVFFKYFGYFFFIFVVCYVDVVEDYVLIEVYVVVFFYVVFVDVFKGVVEWFVVDVVEECIYLK